MCLRNSKCQLCRLCRHWPGPLLKAELLSAGTYPPGYTQVPRRSTGLLCHSERCAKASQKGIRLRSKWEVTRGPNYPWFNSFNTHSIASGSICLSVSQGLLEKEGRRGRLSVKRESITASSWVSEREAKSSCISRMCGRKQSPATPCTEWL